MLITDYLKKECISVNLQSDTKEDVLKELAELQFNAYPQVDRKETLASLFEREKLLTTGIGNGVAIPHARIKSCKEISVAVGLLKKDIDFNSLDNQPVKLVFLIFFPKEQVSIQLRFLARVSRLLQHTSLHDDLFKCKSPDEILSTFKQYEAEHFH